MFSTAQSAQAQWLTLSKCRVCGAGSRGAGHKDQGLHQEEGDHQEGPQRVGAVVGPRCKPSGDRQLLLPLSICAWLMPRDCAGSPRLLLRCKLVTLSEWCLRIALIAHACTHVSTGQHCQDSGEEKGGEKEQDKGGKDVTEGGEGAKTRGGMKRQPRPVANPEQA